MDNWISVDERLPESYRNVLVKQKDNITPYTAYWLEDERSDGVMITVWISIPYDIEFCNDITHWQSLPESPQGI